MFQIEFSIFVQVQFNVNDASAEMVIKKWKSQDAIAPSDFVYREPILAQRVRLFVAAGVRAKRKIQSIYKSEESIPAMVLQLVSECREEGHFTFAIRHLATIDAQRLTRDMAVSAFRIFRTNKTVDSDIQCIWRQNDFTSDG